MKPDYLLASSHLRLILNEALHLRANDFVRMVSSVQVNVARHILHYTGKKKKTPPHLHVLLQYNEMELAVKYRQCHFCKRLSLIDVKTDFTILFLFV